MFQKYKYYIVLLFLLLPLLFIYVNGDNGWGGDFAQYILQANNILEGKSQANQPYIFNQNYSSLAPPAYYPGFPLLLSLIISWFGSNSLVFAYFITFLLIITATFWYKFLKKYFNEKLVIIALVLSSYSNFFLTAKNETLSDIPFALFIIICILLIEKLVTETKWHIALFLLLSSIAAILIKPLGLVLVFAYGSLIFFQTILKPLNYKLNVFYLSVISIICIIFYLFGIPNIIGGTQENDAHFFDLFLIRNPFYTFLENLTYYQINLSTLLSTNNKLYSFFNLILVQIVSLSFLYGFYKSLKKGITFKDIFFIIYIIIVLLFPYHQGFRYLVPIFPLIIYYALYGIKDIPFSSSKKIFVFSFFLFFGYVSPMFLKLKDIANTSYIIDLEYGPNTKDAKQMFAYIKKNTKKEDVVVFSKPRVLGLKTGRKSFSNQPSFIHNEEIKVDVNQFNAKYILKTVELENTALEYYLTKNHSIVIFKNTKYTLYKIQKAQE